MFRTRWSLPSLSLTALLMLAAHPAAAEESDRFWTFELAFAGAYYDQFGMYEDTVTGDPPTGPGAESELDSYLGASLGARYDYSPNAYVQLRGEQFSLHDSNASADLSRVYGALGFTDHLAGQTDLLFKVDARFTTASSVDDPLNELDSDSYGEGGFQLGITTTRDRWRTVLAGVIRYPSEDELDSQLGARIEVERFDERGRYGGFFDAEVLMDEATVRLGIRRAFR